MDVRWSKGCDIPTSESSHVQPLTSYNLLLDIPRYFYFALDPSPLL